MIHISCLFRLTWRRKHPLSEMLCFRVICCVGWWAKSRNPQILRIQIVSCFEKHILKWFSRRNECGTCNRLVEAHFHVTQRQHKHNFSKCLFPLRSLRICPGWNIYNESYLESWRSGCSWVQESLRAQKTEGFKGQLHWAGPRQYSSRFSCSWIIRSREIDETQTQ
jgi:hypothetical protein